jgi:hypothetical protein
VVQALPSSQLAGHELGGSHVSPELTTPLPQVLSPRTPVVPPWPPVPAVEDE